ncbi:Intercellular Adhesion Molecule 5 [Manis pentadactyla]|nr:Intercellular Adhesion Molecule 5 [Manis pentadactyla]
MFLDPTILSCVPALAQSELGGRELANLSAQRTPLELRTRLCCRCRCGAELRPVAGGAVMPGGQVLVASRTAWYPLLQSSWDAGP